MAGISDFFKRRWSRQQHGSDASLEGNQAPPDSSTLYDLVRVERSLAPPHFSYTHAYELVLWKTGQAYTVELRSRLSYGNLYAIGRPWSYRATFESLQAARAHAEVVLADPHRYGDINRDPATDYAWAERARGNGRPAIDFGRPVVRLFYQRPPSLDDGSLAQHFARGQTAYPSQSSADLPIPLEESEVVRQLWGRREPAARAALLTFARTAPLRYGYWSHWKWLYKQAEAAGDVELLAVLIGRIDAATPAGGHRWSWLDQAPSAATLAYLKRRARRTLRHLAGRDPAAYVTVATEVLLTGGRDQTSLDSMYNWVSFDILFGDSGRYTQVGHGRGRYMPRRRRPSVYRDEERAPAAWSERPEVLVRLYTATDLPWQTQEWAYCMLLRRGIARPTLSDDTLIRFLQGASPLLIRVAVAAVLTALEAGREPVPRTLALALYRANGAQRAWIAGYLLRANLPAANAAEIADALGDVMRTYTIGVHFSARLRTVSLLLCTRFAFVAPIKILRPVVPAMLTAGIPELVDLARRTINHLPPAELLTLLQEGAALDDERYDVLAGLLGAAPPARGLHYWQIQQLIFDDNARVRAAGWRLAAALSEHQRSGITWVWATVLSRQGPVLASAVASADALRLLAPDKLERLVAHLGEEPLLVAALSPASFAFLAQRFPLETILPFVAILPDEVWMRVRGSFLDRLRDDGHLGAFWQTVAGPEAPAALARRVVADPVAAASFAEVANPEYLERANSLMAPLLHAWIAAHVELFGRGSRPLLLAATHKDPAVRAWGLHRVAEVGLTTPFALRLLESGLPESIAAGRQYFEAVPPGAPEELDYALAICDSTDRATQTYGRTYIATRRETLPRKTLIRRLAEHPDPWMQETVAAALLETPGLARDLPAFDRVVLRSRGRGRRAREKVKQRLATAPAPELHAARATLLELARGDVGRDREWALEQLARLTLAGELVEGITVDGVGGI